LLVRAEGRATNPFVNSADTASSDVRAFTSARALTAIWVGIPFVAKSRAKSFDSLVSSSSALMANVRFTAFIRNWASGFGHLAERSERDRRGFAVSPLLGGPGGRRGTLGGCAHGDRTHDEFGACGALEHGWRRLRLVF
jgi:hypothetical protein